MDTSHSHCPTASPATLFRYEFESLSKFRSFDPCSVPDSYIGLVSSSMFGGMMLGAVGWGTCMSILDFLQPVSSSPPPGSDLMGRSAAFNATLFFTAVFGLLASFANSFTSLCVVLFLLGSAVGVRHLNSLSHHLGANFIGPGLDANRRHTAFGTHAKIQAILGHCSFGLLLLRSCSISCSRPPSGTSTLVSSRPRCPLRSRNAESRLEVPSHGPWPHRA